MSGIRNTVGLLIDIASQAPVERPQEINGMIPGFRF
jgi:hypothetical protein